MGEEIKAPQTFICSISSEREGGVNPNGKYFVD